MVSCKNYVPTTNSSKVIAYLMYLCFCEKKFKILIKCYIMNKIPRFEKNNAL